MRRRQLGVGLFSAAVLLFEICITRFYSALYYPPVVFAILSLALLGIGLGAAVAAGWLPARAPRRTALYAALMACLALATLLLGSLLGGGTWAMTLLWTSTLLTFGFAGLTIATLYANWAEESPFLYLADLAGAGLGALLALWLLNRVGPINALLWAALMAGGSSWLFRTEGSVRLTWIAPAAAAILLATNTLFGWIDLDMANIPTAKPIAERLAAGGQILTTEWTGFARTDLLDPGNGLPYEMYMDGAAGSVMPPAAGHPALWRDIGFFPFATMQPARVFIIGPGGGLDIWFGLQSEAEEVVAVEVNAAAVDLVRRYATYNGSLLAQPQVRLVADEGRSVLAREEQRYDLIFLSQVVTVAAERDGYALVENDAYTVEAFETYLRHLSENGVIALKLYDEATLTRALITALTALKAQGLSDSEALQHAMAFLDPSADPPIPLLMIGAKPYTREDSLSLGAVANDIGFAPLYLPQLWAQPPLDGVENDVVSLEEIVQAAESDISPTYDDRPFFFQFERGIPASLKALLWGLAALVLVGGVTLLLIQRRAQNGLQHWFSLYFALLGFGFILFEVAVIQQVRLFLGHPTYAIAVVLATLLIGGGVGSGVMGATMQRTRSTLLPRWPAAAVFALILLWIPLWPLIERSAETSPFFMRIAVVILPLFMLAFFMGIPFPFGLRAVGRLGQRQVALAWAVNGAMSVVGSVAAIVIALLVGFSALFFIAALVYLVVAADAYIIRRM